jgi:hypothetical protein
MLSSLLTDRILILTSILTNRILILTSILTGRILTLTSIRTDRIIILTRASVSAGFRRPRRVSVAVGFRRRRRPTGWAGRQDGQGGAPASERPASRLLLQRPLGQATRLQETKKQN